MYDTCDSSVRIGEFLASNITLHYVGIGKRCALSLTALAGSLWLFQYTATGNKLMQVS